MWSSGHKQLSMLGVAVMRSVTYCTGRDTPALRRRFARYDAEFSSYKLLSSSYKFKYPLN